ncbi:MAG: MotA/TolQ/ExbB proton channel family protein [Gammaproteobacteria bacterium]|nr:MotA/TolQ/ExbB proton channel family protein [Gammaproteobacteria bacterium]NNF61625.1 MotA/TolQ/ExbB proton channel family protein [Gammaproteobacteria bacterium]NNM20569.1 MotA/TolQ/ExbB proton channel family protein [Gammaproteobacteria bacterium]
MWTLIIERAWFFLLDLPRRIHAVDQQWHGRSDQQSWSARRIRDAMISRVAIDVNRHLLLMKALMAVLPLLGLLGTVTGMIRVFDVMAVMGTGNARAMAGGVSQATIPTMAGLVAALSGLYFVTLLDRKASTSVERLEDLLSH